MSEVAVGVQIGADALRSIGEAAAGKAFAHHEEAVAEINGKGVVDGVGEAEADLTGKHGLGVARAAAVVFHAVVPAVFALQNAHTGAGGHIGSDLVEGEIMQIPVHVEQHGLQAFFQLDGGRMAVVMEVVGHGAVGGVFEFHAEGHVEVAAEVVTHGQTAAHAHVVRGMGVGKALIAVHVAAEVLNVQRDAGSDIHAHGIFSSGRGLCAGQHENSGQNGTQTKLFHNESPRVEGYPPRKEWRNCFFPANRSPGYYFGSSPR